MKIAEALPRFLQDTCKTDQARRTYRNMLMRLQGSYPGVHLADLTTAQLTEFCLAGRPQPATIKGRRTVLMSFFGWCQWQELVAVDRAANLKYTVKPGNGNGGEHCWMDAEQVAMLLRAQPDDLFGRRAKLICQVGVFLGLRLSEIAALRWHSFSADLARVSLVGKGNKRATLGVPPQLRVELQAWRREVPVGCQTVFPLVKSSRWDTVPQFDWSHPVGFDTIAGDVRKAGERAGFKLAPHDLRRTFAGLLEANGVDIKDISRMMRHSNIATTMVYLEKNQNRVAALADGFTINLGEAL